MPSDQPDAKPSLLADYPIVVALPILWGDQDPLGHVNNVIPIRWFESSRVAYFDALEEVRFSHDRSISPILAKVECSYRKQLHYPDKVHVSASVTRMGGSSFTLTHAIFSEHHGQIAATGESVIVVFDYANQHSVNISDDLRAAIEKLEGGPVPR